MATENQEMSGLFATLGPALIVNPYPIYAGLHASAKVMPAPGLFGLGGYLVTSHAVCSAVLRNKSFGKEGDKVLPPDELMPADERSPDVADLVVSFRQDIGRIEACASPRVGTVNVAVAMVAALMVSTGVCFIRLLHFLSRIAWQWSPDRIHRRSIYRARRESQHC